MNPKMRDLLQLYENTLSTSGIVRAEATLNSELTKNTRLAHARWEIDQLLHGDKRAEDPDFSLARFSFIQGILWAENVFSMAALREQARALYAA